MEGDFTQRPIANCRNWSSIVKQCCLDRVVGTHTMRCAATDCFEFTEQITDHINIVNMKISNATAR